jgi:hypothetical protein
VPLAALAEMFTYPRVVRSQVDYILSYQSILRKRLERISPPGCGRMHICSTRTAGSRQRSIVACGTLGRRGKPFFEIHIKISNYYNRRFESEYAGKCFERACDIHPVISEGGGYIWVMWEEWEGMWGGF